jgi:hypothetical protein
MKTLTVGDYVSVQESDEYANGRVAEVTEDGALIIRPLLPTETVESLRHQGQQIPIKFKVNN